MGQIISIGVSLRGGIPPCHSRNKVRVICPIHGEFWKTPSSLVLGYCCRQCGVRKPFTRERFLRESKEKHGDVYDYSKVGEIIDGEKK